MDPKTHKLSLKEKVGYGFGDAACSMYWKIFTMYLVYFYTDIFGITAAAAGTLLLVTRIWDTANDPIMGVIADRTSTKYGKFRPYLLWFAIPFAVIGVLTFTTPDFGYTGKLVYAYITYLFMMMAYTVVNVPYGALLGVMSPNPKERTKLGSYRFLFAFAGSLLVLAIVEPLAIFFSGLSTGAGAEAFGWQMAMVVIGVLFVIFVYISFFTTKERVLPLKSQQTNLKLDLKDLIANNQWWLLVGAGIFTLIFNAVRDGTIIYYFRYYVETEGVINIAWLDMAYPFSSFFMVIGQAANLFGVLFAVTFAGWIGKRRAYMASMAIAAVASIFFFFLGSNQIWLMFALQIIISFNAGLILPLLISMYADAADYNEWKQGRRATGLIFSSYTTSQKFGWTLGSAMLGYMLAVFGYQAGVAQTDTALMGIRTLMSWIPAAGALVSALFIFFYRLDETRMAEITTELENRREEKGVEP
ncbi:MFS transporter [Balneolales bacterium ANBcel1]|nr:MFS transporter [Balneolales bacterium ANBcel1]